MDIKSSPIRQHNSINLSLFGLENLFKAAKRIKQTRLTESLLNNIQHMNLITSNSAQKLFRTFKNINSNVYWVIPKWIFCEFLKPSTSFKLNIVHILPHVCMMVKKLLITFQKYAKISGYFDYRNLIRRHLAGKI